MRRKQRELTRNDKEKRARTKSRTKQYIIRNPKQTRKTKSNHNTKTTQKSEATQPNTNAARAKQLQTYGRQAESVAARTST